MPARGLLQLFVGYYRRRLVYVLHHTMAVHQACGRRSETRHERFDFRCVLRFAVTEEYNRRANRRYAKVTSLMPLVAEIPEDVKSKLTCLE